MCCGRFPGVVLRKSAWCWGKTAEKYRPWNDNCHPSLNSSLVFSGGTMQTVNKFNLMKQKCILRNYGLSVVLRKKLALEGLFLSEGL